MNNKKSQSKQDIPLTKTISVNSRLFNIVTTNLKIIWYVDTEINKLFQILYFPSQYMLTYKAVPFFLARLKIKRVID